jgi:hypothetical protein
MYISGEAAFLQAVQVTQGTMKFLRIFSRDFKGLSRENHWEDESHETSVAIRSVD